MTRLVGAERITAGFLADVSRETLERLEIFARELTRWNPSSSLVSDSSLPHIWNRHFLDSAQFLKYGPVAGRWLDIGSGGGFPGLVLAILAMEMAPKARFSLVEASTRKCQFLRTVSNKIGVPVRVHECRAEHLDPYCADAITARAVAKLPRLLKLAEPHLAPNGVCLFAKGAQRASEIQLARADWAFTFEEKPSLTDTCSAVLVIQGVTRVN